MSPTVFGLVLTSAMIHAVWSVSIKGSRSPLAFNVLQSIPLAILCLGLLPLVDLGSLPSRFWWLLAATAVPHALYLWGLSLAFAGGDLSLVYPIARSTPAFLPLFAVPVLGEHITLGGGLGIATVVAGMWAIQLGGTRGDASDAPDSETPSRPLRWTAVLTSPPILYAYLALLSTVGYGLADKALMSDLASAPWSSALPRSLFCFFAMWTACSLLFVPAALHRLEPGELARTWRRDKWSVITAATISIAGYGLILKALETTQASYVVAVRQSSVLFVVLLSVAFLKERPSAVRVLGAVATVVGVGLIALLG